MITIINSSITVPSWSTLVYLGLPAIPASTSAFTSYLLHIYSTSCRRALPWSTSEHQGRTGSPLCSLHPIYIRVWLSPLRRLYSNINPNPNTNPNLWLSPLRRPYLSQPLSHTQVVYLLTLFGTLASIFWLRIQARSILSPCAITLSCKPFASFKLASTTSHIPPRIHTYTCTRTCS